LLTISILATLASPARADDWGPWNQAWIPVNGVAATAAAPSPRAGIFEVAYRWYRDDISPKNGAKCPFYPTCSSYGIQSVRRFGPLVGSLYTLDRLLREYPGMDKVDHYPLVTPHALPRLSDPVPPRRDRTRG
jgi:putative component of membrane protein insertase Oxa1/YidC/SpoIIIJ protein YidD